MSNKPNDGGPAFPVASSMWRDGMSLRAWLTGQALGKVTINQRIEDHTKYFDYQEVAKTCVGIADAAIEELEKEIDDETVDDTPIVDMDRDRLRQHVVDQERKMRAGVFGTAGTNPSNGGSG